MNTSGLRLSVLALIVVLALGTDVYAQTSFSLHFNELPSKQDWVYEHVNNPLLENGLQGKPLFRVDGKALYQDTVSAGLFQGGGGDNAYRKSKAVSTDRPFTLTVAAEVTDFQANSANPTVCSFSFGAVTGQQGSLESYALCITKTAATPTTAGIQTVTLLDSGSVETALGSHHYRLDVLPGVGSNLYIDGTLKLTSGKIRAVRGESSSDLFLGDGTGGANAKATVTMFTYSSLCP